MKLYKYTEEELRNAVAESFSIRSALAMLGVSPAGGNYIVFKRAVSYFNIDTSHFRGQGWSKINPPGPRRSIQDYLSNEHSITSYSLKNRLIKEGIKEAKCESCGLTSWLDKNIPLELHHINGISNDNTLSNLKILCPNCHAFTPNYRSKNRSS